MPDEERPDLEFLGHLTYRLIYRALYFHRFAVFPDLFNNPRILRQRPLLLSLYNRMFFVSSIHHGKMWRNASVIRA